MNRERFIVFVMPVLRLHKLNIILRPHTLDCLRIGVQPHSLSIHPYEMDWTKFSRSMGAAHGDGEINKNTPDKIVLHS